jgi:hypothetical protein
MEHIPLSFNNEAKLIGRLLCRDFFFSRLRSDRRRGDGVQTFSRPATLRLFRI